MSFTYDVSTQTGLIRLMIGDTVQGSANFSDEEILATMNMALIQTSGPSVPFGTGVPANDVLCYTCANLLDSLAARFASKLNNITLGSLKIDETSKVNALKEQAQRWRDIVENMPAWGIAEENLSTFNELQIIRNWVMRTEV
jgi:hypothetical protein